MPELPEVETVIRTLRPAIVGETIRHVWSSGEQLRLRRNLDPVRLRRIAVGATIARVRRRGKYILIDLGPKGGFLVHLGMTGRLLVEKNQARPAKHTHVIWSLSNGCDLRFVDPRRFGWVEAAAELDDLPQLRALGPDALTELDEAKLKKLLAASRAPIKSFLLDQHRIAGLGNIYVCEALFLARVHPRTPANRLQDKARALSTAVRQTLETAIANCGTSFRDFVDSSGTPGRNEDALLVYGREGEACKVCRRPLHRRVDSGRSTFFCGRCQKAG